MSSKKTYITDTENNKVFPQTTIDQILKPNGTDRFKVVEPYSEEQWNTMTKEEKAKIPLALVFKKFLLKASAILYKNDKSVEKELDELNTSLYNTRADLDWSNMVTVETSTNQLLTYVPPKNGLFIVEGVTNGTSKSTVYIMDNESRARLATSHCFASGQGLGCNCIVTANRVVVCGSEGALSSFAYRFIPFK